MATHEGGHYVVPIPWTDGRSSTPNNRAQAKGRLDNLIKQLHKGDHFGKHSDKIIKRQLLEEGHKVYVEYDDGGLAAFKEKRNDLEEIKKQAEIPEREAKEQHEKAMQEAEARVQARLSSEQSEKEFRRLDVNNDGLVSVTEMTGQLTLTQTVKCHPRKQRNTRRTKKQSIMRRSTIKCGQTLRRFSRKSERKRKGRSNQ